MEYREDHAQRLLGPDSGRASGVTLAALLLGDLVGLCRGKAIPVEHLPARFEQGIAWTPGNLALDPFGVIAQSNPFGALGDVQLRPVRETAARVGHGTDAPVDIYLCDVYDDHGRPWLACPRRTLRSVLEALSASAGLTVAVAFEHEFTLLPSDRPAEGGFSLSRLRRAEPFVTRLVDALRAAGCEPESVIAEYGPDQFEVPCAPTDGLAAADRALIFREVVRDVARWCDRRATFAPLLHPDGIGNGVHLHLSLWEEGGRPATYDARRPRGLTREAEGFAAGVLRHLRALCAVTAPSPISSWRLVPGRWSAGRPVCALADREAVLRVPTTFARYPDGRERHCNLEFRAIDATASPHLALACLVRAGLDGIDGELTLDEHGATQGGPGLPRSLREALVAFEDDSLTGGWLSSELWACFSAVKRQELDAATNEDRGTTCRRYCDAY
jgi:glutamine synthetase